LRRPTKLQWKGEESSMASPDMLRYKGTSSYLLYIMCAVSPGLRDLGGLCPFADFENLPLKLRARSFPEFWCAQAGSSRAWLWSILVTLCSWFTAPPLCLKYRLAAQFLRKTHGKMLLRTRIGRKRPTRAWGSKVERAWVSCDRFLRASIGTRECSWTSAEIGGVVQLGEDSRQSAAPHSLCTCSWSTAMRAD
jgi:hypothetical protein